jgi:hypothetical protein
MGPLLRELLFVPESVSLEKAMVMMQERAARMIFAVDEFGRIPQEGKNSITTNTSLLPQRSKNATSIP